MLRDYKAGCTHNEAATRKNSLLVQLLAHQQPKGNRIVELLAGRSKLRYGNGLKSDLKKLK